MQKIFYSIFFLIFCVVGIAQNNETLAHNYFDNGEFEKALLLYKALQKEKPYNLQYIYKLVQTYQQLEKYEEAQQLLIKSLSKRQSPTLLVELGYNYQLKDSIQKANKNYNLAISSIDKNPNYVYSVARQFENHSLLDQAIEVYNKGKILNPKNTFTIQLARIYGDKGDIEGMFSNYLEYIIDKPNYISEVKLAISEFVTEDNTNKNNTVLRKLLLKNIQTQPDAHWYNMLSWLYVQERAYNKSFIQERALYKRNPESLERMNDLALTALEDEDYRTATTILNYILKTTQDASEALMAHQYLLNIERQSATTPKALNTIKDKYLNLFETFGKNGFTLSLQLAYAEFLAFSLKDTESAKSFLKESLKQEVTDFQNAKVKMLLADILVLQEKFNEALIFYSQIQVNIKNSTLSQEARFKVAKTSYYKGDFDWAESQLKILKSSTSQLIANDALDLKLLISDNKYEDSLRTSLKLYAKADLLAYQNKTEKAIQILDRVLEEHKGESITDQALFKQAKLFEKQKEYQKAETNYLKIIADYSEDILIDDAYYFLAELYSIHLANTNEAKALYEKLIFNHEDSIYFIDARKKYRKLRGDAIN